jgi:serine O-acetyltransferase
MLKLVDLSTDALLDFVTRQLEHFFPDGRTGARAVLARHLDETLTRLSTCIAAVRIWRPGEFDYLHTSQYATFLYFLANTVWRQGDDPRICSKLFALNKALNGIDLFYEIAMPDVFLIGHSVGIVLAKATYGNYLVLFQNSTVGRSHLAAPVIGERVVLFPNSAVVGPSVVRDGTIVSQGVGVINAETPGECVVYRGERGALVFREPKRDLLADYFRL